MNKQAYDIYLNHPAVGQVLAAECVVLESAGVIEQFGFRYTDDYLAHEYAFALDPVQLPLPKKRQCRVCAAL